MHCSTHMHVDPTFICLCPHVFRLFAHVFDHSLTKILRTQRPKVQGTLWSGAVLGKMVRGMEELAFSKLLDRSCPHINHILPPTMLYPSQVFCSICQFPSGQILNRGFGNMILWTAWESALLWKGASTARLSFLSLPH